MHGQTRASFSLKGAILPRMLLCLWAPQKMWRNTGRSSCKQWGSKGIECLTNESDVGWSHGVGQCPKILRSGKEHCVWDPSKHRGASYLIQHSSLSGIQSKSTATYSGGSVTFKKNSKTKTGWGDLLCQYPWVAIWLVLEETLFFPFMGQLEIWAELTYRIWNFLSGSLLSGIPPKLLLAAIVPNSAPDTSNQKDSGFLKEL